MLDFGSGSFFLTPSQLADSPSFRHGISADTEKALRLYGCEIIEEACILLRLPQAVAATAQVLLHRFFCKQSFVDFDVRSVAASCFWLSMKLEEEAGVCNRGPKRSQLDRVVSMFEHIRARREESQPLPPHAPAFKVRKEALLKLEARILVEFGFVCHVEHPHKLMLSYLNCLEASTELLQESWNLVNDSLRTTLCVCYQSNVVACGIIYAAARRLSIPLPETPPWWVLFDVTLDEIHSTCRILADLYRQPKAHFIDVKAPLPMSIAVASSLPEDSPVACDVKIVDSLPSSLESTSDCVRSTDVICSNNIPRVPQLSASLVLNTLSLNASGCPSKDLVSEPSNPQIQNGFREHKKRLKESSVESDPKRSRWCSCRDGARDCRKDHKHKETGSRSSHGELDDKHKQREDYRRCSRYYDRQSLVSRHGYHSHVRGSLCFAPEDGRPKPRLHWF